MLPSAYGAGEERNRGMKKKILTILTAAAVLLGSMLPQAMPAKEAQAAPVRANLEITDEEKKELHLMPGTELTVEIPVRATICGIGSAVFSADVPEDAPFTIEKITVVNRFNGVEQENYSGIPHYSTTSFLRFIVKTKETAKIGKYKFVLSYEDLYDSVYEDTSLEFSKELALTAVVENELLPAQLVIGNLKLSGTARPGETIDISFTVENSGEVKAKNVCISAMYSGNGLIPNYTDYTKRLGDIARGEKKTVTLPVKIMDSVTDKIIQLPINISYKDSDGQSYSGNENNVLYLEIEQGEEASKQLAISDFKVTGEVKPGNSIEISFVVENRGKWAAKNVCVNADYPEIGIIPDGQEFIKKIGDIAAGEKKPVTISVKLLSAVTERLVRLPIGIEYKDEKGQNQSGADNNILYLEVDVPNQTGNDGSLLASNVRQSPANPKAGEKVTMTFDLQNIGEKDYTGVKLFTDYSTGFEPINADPYRYIGTIGAGQKITVSVGVIVGKNMPEGHGVLGVEFRSPDGMAESISLHVLGIQSKEESLGASKPKLMVSEFQAGEDDIKTGENFDFTFSVYNTHSDVAAKNIKVTVNSDTFSVTKGSNSFFLAKIEPGQSEELTISLKASAAATTGSYPINIQMEYEYEGMRQSESQDGVTVTETKMVLIKENLRVSVENIMVGGWMTPIEGQTTQLSFSAYNMGKSMLNNVYFTLEGDFAIANGSSYYYGTLQSGMPDYIEMDIIPLTAGNAVGTLIIHMEDSNGDEVLFEKELTAFIQEAGGFDPGMDEPYYPQDPVIPADVKPVKKLLPNWIVYGGALAVLFLAGLFVAKAVRIKVYKKKHRDEE